METIVKGKIIEEYYTKSFFTDEEVNSNTKWEDDYRGYNSKDKILKLDYLHRDLITYEHRKLEVSFTKRNRIIDYETFFVSDLDFVLQVNDYIFINDYSYKIEKVEGTEDNTIIYYVNHVIDTIFNKEEYITGLLNCQKSNYKIIDKIKSLIADIEIEIERDLVIENNKKNKWYEFWK
jgi:hypothetical protein